MLIGLIFGPSVYPLECLRGYEQRSEPNAKWSFSCVDGNCPGERPNEMVDELPNEISCSFERNFRSRERIADNKSFSLERIPVRRPTVHKRDVKYFVVQAHVFCRTDFILCRNDFCFLSYRPNGILSYRRSGGFWGICRTGSDILSHRLRYFVGRSARPIALPYRETGEGGGIGKQVGRRPGETGRGRSIREQGGGRRWETGGGGRCREAGWGEA